MGPRTEQHSPKAQPKGGSSQPIAGRCGAKLRNSKPAKYCKQAPVKGRKRCKLHGGKTPRGPASPHFKHGYGSVLMKDLKLAERFEAARSDPKLLDLRDEIALLETLALTIVEKDGLVKAREKILKVIDRQRKLVETVHRVEREPDKAVPIEQVYTFMRSVTALVLEIISDKTQATQFLEGLRQLVGRTQVIDAVATPSK